MLGGIYAHIRGLCLVLLFALFAESVFASEFSQNTEKVTRKPYQTAFLAPEITVNLEGRKINAAVKRDHKGNMLVRAEPIFVGLDDEFVYNVESGVLLVHRSQDGVKMELYTKTGIVKANGKVLGKLEEFGQISESELLLTPNAITVLSGAIAKFDEKNNKINFELDPRLRVATGFEIFIENVPLGNINPEPKAIGSVMLLPLKPIAKALGHRVEILQNGSVVKVYRAQDSAELSLNLDTGLVKQNDRPIGISKDISYIDKAALLLPLGTIESLTGTIISVEAGSNKVEIVLDGRLKGAIKPSASVDEVTKNTPFTVEAISLHIGTDTINTIATDMRYKGFNGRLRIETPDLPGSAEEARPSWLSLDYAHVNGGYGAIGDYSADLRELDGVNLRRIRGISYAKESENGRFAMVAGVPAEGTKKISKDQSRRTYKGFAAGIRYADKNGWELGLSHKKDGLSDDQMSVLSAISGRLGRKKGKKLNWDANLDIGGFNGSAREKTIDSRAALNMRYQINSSIAVEAHASYDGVEFLRTDLQTEARDRELNPDNNNTDNAGTNTTPDIRTSGTDIASYGVSAQIIAKNDIGIFTRPAASVRVGVNKTGVFETQASASKSSDNKLSYYGGSFNTGIKPSNTSFNIDFNAYEQNSANNRVETGNQINVRLFQDTKYISARASYTGTQKNNERRQDQIDLQLSAKPLNLPLPKNANLSVAPSVLVSWRDDQGNKMQGAVNGGIIANLDSGDLLGSQTQLQASLGVLQNFNYSGERKSDKFLTVSLGRKLKINKNMVLGLSYRNDLSGNERIGVYLDGRFGFNEKRKFKKTRKGRGILKGRAFFDKNRDGIKQEDEPGIGGVLLRIKNTRLALRTDREGYFTIQNIKQGLQELQVDNRSLPLGFGLSEQAMTKATIKEDYITDISLPIVQRGQIRGFAYIDANQNGRHDKGETRLEGAKLLLRQIGGEEYEAWASSFGQFAFDDLPAGKYELAMIATNNRGSIPTQKPIIIELGQGKKREDNMMVKINIAAREDKSLQAKQNFVPKMDEIKANDINMGKPKNNGLAPP